MPKTRATDWKSRYESSVSAQNQLESSWLETEGMLRRAVRRLAIAGRGRDAELDRYLNDIQRLAQTKRDRDLDAALDRMAQRVIELVESDDLAQEAAATSLQAAPIVALLELLQLEQAVKLRLAARVEQQDNLDGIGLQGVAEEINRHLGGAATGETATGNHAGGEVDETIESVMMTLVSRLSLLQGFGASKIRARIVERINRREWHIAIEETIDAVERLLHMLDHAKNDLESFIVGLTRELGAITRAIDADSADTASNRRDTEALNELVRDGVTTIEKDVAEASDISIVKSAIADNISQIRSGVDQYIGQIQQRYAASSERNRELGERMRQMEAETETLQHQLDENRRLLLTDALTGAYSRLAYDQAIEQALHDWQQAQAPFAYAILDIDHFKHINDNFGHSAGDRALQLVARLIHENARQDDAVYRLGGEEFVLLLPDASAAEADAVVEKIRAAIGASRFHFKQRDVQLTLSAGITEARPGDDVDSIYQRADNSLYRAKESGRNRQFIAD